MSTSLPRPSIATAFLESATQRLQNQKTLAEKAIGQLEDDDLFWVPGEESNSIAILIQHVAGNMLSRWTDFLTSDGEKPNRGRDAEFESVLRTRAELMAQWQSGWRCLFDALHSLNDDDLLKTITIRNEPHLVIDAILRQLSHYSQHVGQILYIAKARRDREWHTLSMPRKR